MTRDEKIMRWCIELALKGAGYVSPNPLVGCVIVKNGKIISEGYHQKFGGYHAERNAINSALNRNINLKGSSLYVNLEPCAHYGKTPPCADFIIANKISKVIIGTKDPYQLVSGNGIRKLKRAGINVKTGILENECRSLNKFFFKYVTTGLPYVILKTAMTIDGKIADKKYRSKWISSVESRRIVHGLRTSYDAVLVGKNTVKHDNPLLTARLVKGRNPFRIVIDSKLSLSLRKNIFSDGFANRTIVLISKNADKGKIKVLEKRNVKIIFCKSQGKIIDIRDALKSIAKRGITSIMVEGGAKTYSEFMEHNLTDEYMIFISPKVMGNGIDAFNQRLDMRKYKNINYFKTGQDILINIKK